MSTGDSRFSKGEIEGRILAEKLKSGEVTLEDGEFIKLVGHSMGAAHAMGMAQGLIDSDIDPSLIKVFLFAPHQPNQIQGVDGVEVFQIGRDGDEVSSEGPLSSATGSKHARVPGADWVVAPDREDEEYGGHYVQTFTTEEFKQSAPVLFQYLIDSGYINSIGDISINLPDLNIPEFVGKQPDAVSLYASLRSANEGSFDQDQKRGNPQGIADAFIATIKRDAKNNAVKNFVDMEISKGKPPKGVKITQGGFFSGKLTYPKYFGEDKVINLTDFILFTVDQLEHFGTLRFEFGENSIQVHFAAKSRNKNILFINSVGEHGVLNDMGIPMSKTPWKGTKHALVLRNGREEDIAFALFKSQTQLKI